MVRFRINLGEKYHFNKTFELFSISKYFPWEVYFLPLYLLRWLVLIKHTEPMEFLRPLKFYHSFQTVAKKQFWKNRKGRKMIIFNE